MVGLLLGLLILVASCVLGVWCDLVNGWDSPPFYWLLGAWATNAAWLVRGIFAEQKGR